MPLAGLSEDELSAWSHDTGNLMEDCCEVRRMMHCVNHHDGIEDSGRVWETRHVSSYPSEGNAGQSEPLAGHAQERHRNIDFDAAIAEPCEELTDPSRPSRQVQNKAFDRYLEDLRDRTEGSDQPGVLGAIDWVEWFRQVVAILWVAGVALDLSRACITPL